MAVTSVRRVVIGFSGDYYASAVPEAAANASSPAQADFVSLTTGPNTITPPTGATALTIVPPAGNTATITLKGVSGDTGVVLHKTDPSSIGLNTSTTSFVLTVSTTISGTRLIWS